MENLEGPKPRDDEMKKLYEASLRGYVSTLNTLIEKDPLIVNRVSLYPFTETPLHIASLLGHLKYCEGLLQKNPSLASEVDSEGRSPLHLASANGHTEVVKALLMTNKEMCLVRDKDEMLPLHFAAMRGRVEVIKELIKAKPECIREMTETHDGSVLHLCVRYNHLEAFKFLVESLRGDHHHFLSLKDKEDNSVLHLAVKRRQIKIVEYLLSLSGKCTEGNTLNTECLAAMDMLKRYQKDFMNQNIVLTEEIEKLSNEVITQEAVSSATQVREQQTIPSTSRQEQYSSQSTTFVIVQSVPDHPQASTTPNNDPQQTPVVSLRNNDPPTESSQKITNEHGGDDKWDKVERFCRKYLIDEGNWMDKKTREQLMVAATVIATMTFQSVISPPGGVWQADTTQDGYACSQHDFCEAGTAVLGYAWSSDYMKFVLLNSASFFASLCVMLILMSGFPLENKVVMWVISILIIAAASCMLLTYMWALGLMSPNHIYHKIYKLGFVLVATWAFLLGSVILIQISRIVFWARSRRKSSKISTDSPVSRICSGAVELSLVRPTSQENNI